MENPWIYAAVAAGLIAGGFVWRAWGGKRRQARRQAALFEFGQRREQLEAEFLQAAAATGKPRGLRWKACELSGPPLFAVDDASGELVALVAATISFEAIEGGGMEDVEAVGNLRSATAVFVNRRDRWTTEGRVIFNLEPAEALRRFQSTLRPLVAPVAAS